MLAPPGSAGDRAMSALPPTASLVLVLIFLGLDLLLLLGLLFRAACGRRPYRLCALQEICGHGFESPADIRIRYAIGKTKALLGLLSELGCIQGRVLRQQAGAQRNSQPPAPGAWGL